MTFVVPDRCPKVFISHASTDAWIARQMEKSIRHVGAEAFLDCENVHHGDDFEEKIICAAEECTELLVLFTPMANQRKYVWMEIGMFLFARKRIVGVLYGVKKHEIAADEMMPVALKRIISVEINDIDSYFEQLQCRVSNWGKKHGQC